MEKAKQISVALTNRKGQLAKACKALADAKINIEAISVLECTEMGTVRLIVDKPKEAELVLKKAGFTTSKEDVFVASLPNKVGVLAEVAAKMADRGVNVNFAYGSASKGSSRNRIVFSVDDRGKAARILKKF